MIEGTGEEAADDEKAGAEADWDGGAGPEACGKGERRIAECGVAVDGLRGQRGSNHQKRHGLAANGVSFAGTLHLRVGIETNGQRDGHKDHDRPKHACHGTTP